MKSHATAIVESQDVGEGTRIWAFAHVLEGAKIGRNGQIGDHSFVEGGVVIGDNVTIKNQVCIWEGVTIEDDVFVGPRVTFTNDVNPRSPRMESAKARYASRDGWLSKTRVGRGSSIGAAATIRSGVELGPYSLVGAAALVTKDVAPFALVVGVPAERVADVCGCGQKLAGAFDATTCEHCGQTPADRQSMLADCKDGLLSN